MRVVPGVIPRAGDLQKNNILGELFMDMNQIMEQAQQFQQRIAGMQEELAGQRITSSVGGGMVSAVVNGRHELLELKIDKEVIDPDDPVMLQDLIIAAVNDGMSKAREATKAEMAKLTGGLNMGASLSGLFGS